MHAYPPPQGLYDGNSEHDACGVAFVATLTGVPSHDIVTKALTALRNLEHRGAAGAESNSGDGAGILLQVPDRFFREVAGIDLPAAGSYAVGTAFIPGDAGEVAKIQERISAIAVEEGLQVLGWREVPTDPSSLGKSALDCMPAFRQIFVSAPGASLLGMDLERLAFCLRKRAERETEVYFPSLSSRTIAYKGMLTTDQLDHVFSDLLDERVESAVAVVHSRFSTNTFPSWPLSHPFRFIAHTGEINTVMGNRNWMRAREALLDAAVIPGDLQRLFPICTPGASDSASFDEVLELLHMGGRSLPHAVLMMIPEAWENHGEMDAKRRAFYEFHSTFMEPWDGPACVTFTDGKL
ncbi:MAG: glutamate synthase subunit alpha, partial [Marmoricola sp.]